MMMIGQALGGPSIRMMTGMIPSEAVSLVMLAIPVGCRAPSEH